MTTESPTLEEPHLTIQPPPSAFFLRRRFLRSFGPAAIAAVGLLVTLLVSGNVVVPFEPTLELSGKMGSKADFFEDAQVQKILMRHHIRVHVTRTGSRDVAIHDLDKFDFVLLSGEPAAGLVRAARANVFVGAVRQPFTSPIVLATFRRYAETLEAKGIATAVHGPDPLYYSLDVRKLVEAIRSKATWDSFGIQNAPSNTAHASNSNQVLAQMSNVCDSNSGATYLTLVAYLENARKVPVPDPPRAGAPAGPVTLNDAHALANKIKPLLNGQGYASADLAESYWNLAEGDKPIVVIYAHQYLARQLEIKAATGRPDTDRVLLYPKDNILTKPQFVSLNSPAEKLGDLITFDPDLQRRAMELGFGVATPPVSNKSQLLYDFLTQQGVPTPEDADNDSRTPLPALPVLEEMIKTVGDCP